MVVPGKQMMRASKYMLVSGKKNLNTHMYIDTQVHDTQVYRRGSVAPNIDRLTLSLQCRIDDADQIKVLSLQSWWSQANHRCTNVSAPPP